MPNWLDFLFGQGAIKKAAQGPVPLAQPAPVQPMPMPNYDAQAAIQKAQGPLQAPGGMLSRAAATQPVKKVPAK